MHVLYELDSSVVVGDVPRVVFTDDVEVKTVERKK